MCKIAARLISAKRRKTFSSSLTFGKKMLSVCFAIIVRRPRWIHNPTLPVASSGSSIVTFQFGKMTAPDGPASHTVFEQVLLWLLQT